MLCCIENIVAAVVLSFLKCTYCPSKYSSNVATTGSLVSILKRCVVLHHEECFFCSWRILTMHEKKKVVFQHTFLQSSFCSHTAQLLSQPAASVRRPPGAPQVKSFSQLSWSIPGFLPPAASPSVLEQDTETHTASGEQVMALHGSFSHQCMTGRMFIQTYRRYYKAQNECTPFTTIAGTALCRR